MFGKGARSDFFCLLACSTLGLSESRTVCSADVGVVDDSLGALEKTRFNRQSIA